jgi:integrase
VNGEIRRIDWADFAAEDVRILRANRKTEAYVKATEKVLNKFGAECRPAGPAAVTPRLIERFVTSLRGRGLSPASVNHDLRHLRAALNRAKDRGYLREVPKIKRVREKKKLVRALQPDEFDKLPDACGEIDTDARASQL